MKTNLTLLFIAVSFVFVSCSGDDEGFVPGIGNLQDKNISIDEPLTNFGAVEIPGFPKSIQIYHNNILQYMAQYYSDAKGNLIRVNYSYPVSSSEIFTDSYHYNSQGMLTKLDGHDVYDFHWKNGRIVEADKYNGMWYGKSRIVYEYNAAGLLTQTTEDNLDFLFSMKTTYTYFADGNLKMIEESGDFDNSGTYTLYYVTRFPGYKEAENLFPELIIIPGQIAQHHFPASMEFQHLTETGYDRIETYDYKYDSEGRVIEKSFDNDRVVYQYY